MRRHRRRQTQRAEFWEDFWERACDLAWWIAVLAFVLLVFFLPSSNCRAETFDVPAGWAPGQILTWSYQAHRQVLFRFALVDPIETVPVKGNYEPLQALRLMLKYTRLKVEAVNARTVAVFEEKPYCHPEWGADAPLPPCVPQPLTIHRRSDP